LAPSTRRLSTGQPERRNTVSMGAFKLARLTGASEIGPCATGPAHRQPRALAPVGRPTPLSRA
jgi:hypothetical protein